VSTGHASAYLELREGKRNPCEEFVRLHYGGIYRWFLSLTGCPERAADLTQDTFAGFWQSLGRTVPQAPPKVWLYSIGRNLWRKHCRQRKQLRRQDAELPLDEIATAEPPPFAAAEQQELSEAVQAQVSVLPDDYREAFTLRYWEEFEYEEIAAVQGISRDLARWRVFRAKQLVQARLKSWQMQEEPHVS